jgi:hypothetical protein
MCPVCRARFRGATTCLRCGADLTVLMKLAASAWRLRQAARRALAASEFAHARELAARAQQICSTSAGRGLEYVGACLSRWPFAACVVESIVSLKNGPGDEH